VFKRGANELPYGQAQALAELLAAVPDEDESDYQPSSPAERFLYSPTDRPDEPITAGLPFGPGPDVSRYALEDDRSFRERLAQTIEAHVPRHPSRDMRRFLARLRSGE
jgi:hypothetical protein